VLLHGTNVGLLKNNWMEWCLYQAMHMNMKLMNIMKSVSSYAYEHEAHEHNDVCIKLCIWTWSSWT
jgi:hypothetical protein